MPWLQFEIDVTREQVSLFEDALLELGAVAVTLRDAGDQPVLEPAVGEQPLWDQIIISALFMPEHQVDDICSGLGRLLDLSIPVPRSGIIADKEWERAWMEDYQPMSFGRRLWVCPSWVTPPDPAAVNLLLDPGLAFGTGTHPTTSMCLSWLDATDINGFAVLDYGCGSGILAIAAALLGANHVYALDNDPQALIATRDNAERNHCMDIEIMVAGQRPAGGTVDVVMANILADPLCNLSQGIGDLVVKGGNLILSGILVSQAPAVCAAYGNAFDIRVANEKEGWVLLEGIKKY